MLVYNGVWSNYSDLTRFRFPLNGGLVSHLCMVVTTSLLCIAGDQALRAKRGKNGGLVREIGKSPYFREIDRLVKYYFIWPDVYICT